jgi:hypothetical protein
MRRLAWTDLTLGASAERQSTPERVWVLRALRRSGRNLQTAVDHLSNAAADREKVLAAAALALEAATELALR